MGGYSRLEGPSTDRAYPNMIEEVRFAPDSALEGDGFEPSVPRRETTLRDCLLIEGSQVRRRLAAGGRWIRTLGPPCNGTAIQDVGYQR